MTGKRIIYNYAHVGALTADLVLNFKLPCAATLTHVSACGSNATDSTLSIGVAGTDADGVLSAFDIGQSDVPTVADKGDFNGALVTSSFYHFLTTQTVTATVSIAGSTDVADLTLCLTFLEG